MAIFTAPGTWDGGEYELALELGPVSDEQTLRVLDAIWSFPGMEGCYAHRDREPEAQERFAPMLGVGSLGVAILPDGVRLACASCTLRYEEDGTVWVEFYVPIGALGNVYPEVSSYPFGPLFDESSAPMAWETRLEDFMRRLAYVVYKAVPFSLALVGFDVGGETCRAEIDKNGVPNVRWWGYLVPDNDKLNWYAPTRYGAQISVS